MKPNSETLAPAPETIEWHEISYLNWKQSLDKHEERTLAELGKIKSERERLNFLKFQIDEAKKIGKASFDRYKFRVKKVIPHD